MTELALLVSLAEDKRRSCERQYRLTHTSFLNLAERSALTAHLRSEEQNYLFYGGYPDAERTILFFLPDYMEKSPFLPEEEDQPICVLHCQTNGGRTLTHRDYLGALLSLGLERNVIGDILVGENGADILIMKQVSDFLYTGFTKVGSSSLTVSVEPLGALILPKQNTKLVRESVASFRLDNMLSAAFNVSRSSVADAISHGLVFVNDMEMKKADARIHVGDKLVLRGKGKAYFREEGNMTRKGRLSVLFEIYQ